MKKEYKEIWDFILKRYKLCDKLSTGDVAKLMVDFIKQREQGHIIEVDSPCFNINLLNPFEWGDEYDMYKRILVQDYLLFLFIIFIYYFYLLFLMK
jgi:hypothetical protein